MDTGTVFLCIEKILNYIGAMVTDPPRANSSTNQNYVCVPWCIGLSLLGNKFFYHFYIFVVDRFILIDTQYSFHNRETFII